MAAPTTPAGPPTLREIARRAGVSHQAPYHYFADREAILAELAGEGFDQLYDYMVSAVGLVRDRDRLALEPGRCERLLMSHDRRQTFESLA